MVALPFRRSLVFETERLLLRLRTLADTDDRLGMDRDPEVTRFVSGPWSDPSAHRAFIGKRTLPWVSGMGCWTILLRQDASTFVGWVLPIPVDGIGGRLCRRFWGSGFATKAARRLPAHAFDVLRPPELVAEIDPGNLGSLKVRKIGMERRGRVEHAERPAMRYALTSDEASKAS